MFEHLIGNNLLCGGDNIVVGVSGGADSMLLLWALLDKQKQIKFEMTVVHINHGIRNETAERDQKFVENFCKKRKINQISLKIDAKSCKNGENLTLEEAARKLRYDAFEKVMKSQKCNKLFLAHHKNDQAETILMHIFRGSGILGACGMRQSKKIIRPLLNLSKKEILEICKDYKIEFVEDETNEDSLYSRNYIRNEVIPLIEKRYPNVVDLITRFGKRCEEIQNFIEMQINEKLIIDDGKSLLLKGSVFEYPNFIIKEYIKRVFEKLSIFEDVEAKHYKALVLLYQMNVNKQINLPHKIIAKKTYGGIKFFKQTRKNNLKNEFEFVIGTIDIENVGKIETKIISAEDVEYGNGCLYADFNKISNDAVWRMRKLGDYFSKLGTGSKKLNDYFTDKKIESEQRDNIPVLANGSVVLVVAGEDISENVKIDSQTDKIVSIKFVKN